MTREFFSQLRSIALDDEVFRNIVSLRKSADLFDDLSEEPAERAVAAAAELAHKPPPFVGPASIVNRPFEEADWTAAIGFPFQRWSRSRYSDGSYGVWYGADSIATTVHETVYHWVTGLLGDAEGFMRAGVTVERSLYQVHLDAILLDFRPAIDAYPALVDPTDYHFTQQIGAEFARQQLPGLMTRSARCSGDTVAVFRPDFLTRPRQISYLTYRTTDAGIEVERTPGTVWLRLATPTLR